MGFYIMKTTSVSRRGFLLGLGAVGLVASAPSLVSQSAYAQASTADIIAELQEGGLVVYFRHGATTWSGVDRIEWPRSRQRLLSDLGEQQSEIIGQAFRDLNIQVGQVLASPFARCRDMAEIAFGRVEEEMLLIGLLSDSEGRPDRVAYLTERMNALPAAGMNRVIVGHSSNIRTVASTSLGEGDAVVVRPNGSGFEVLGTLTPAQWQQAAG